MHFVLATLIETRKLSIGYKFGVCPMVLR